MLRRMVGHRPLHELDGPGGTVLGGDRGSERLGARGESAIDRLANAVCQPTGVDRMPRNRFRSDFEAVQSFRPEWLVHDAGNRDRGPARADRGRGRSGATVVDDRRTARKEPLVRYVADRQ